MTGRRRWMWVVALLASGVPLTTIGTCARTGAGGSFHMVSSNDNLVQDMLDIVFGEDDD